MKVTITDIAKIAGVSVATVSRVINNKSKGVSDATRERIWKIVEENNFQPSAIARGLVTKQSNIIGLLIPNITNPYHLELAKGVEDAAAERGYNTILCDGANSTKKESSHIDFLNDHYVSGVVYSNTEEISEETFLKIKSFSMKSVFVDSRIAWDRAYNINADNKKAMKEVVRFLYENGHRQIAFVGGPATTYSTIKRFEGYKEALDELGIPFDDQLVIYGDYIIETSRERISELLDKNINFTALACCNDMMAIGAYEVFEERSLRVPEDVSVVGFDDIYMAKHIRPRLTTMRQPTYEMGRESADVLIDLIEGNGNRSEMNIRFDTALQVRDSVKKMINFDRS